MDKEHQERLKHVAHAAIGVAAVYAASRVVQSYRRNGEQGQVYITPYHNFLVERLRPDGRFGRIAGKVLGLNLEDGSFEDLEIDESTWDMAEGEVAGFEKLYVIPDESDENTLQNG